MIGILPMGNISTIHHSWDTSTMNPSICDSAPGGGGERGQLHGARQDALEQHHREVSGPRCPGCPGSEGETPLGQLRQL